VCTSENQRKKAPLKESEWKSSGGLVEGPSSSPRNIRGEEITGIKATSEISSPSGVDRLVACSEGEVHRGLFPET
jgi:hypothetical protein